jgi:hypothetical protein
MLIESDAVGIDSKIGNFTLFKPFSSQSRRLLVDWSNVGASGSCFKSFAIADATLIASYGVANGSVLWQAFCEFWIASGAEQAGANDALSTYLAQELMTNARYDWVKALQVSSAWRNVTVAAPVTLVACDFEKKSQGGVCVCKWGYAKSSDGKCVACAKDHYKATISDQDPCVACPVGSKSGVGQRVCGCVNTDFDMVMTVLLNLLVSTPSQI